jgi:lipoprotein-anchoring transpeptidase ErfK/SrfK
MGNDKIIIKKTQHRVLRILLLILIPVFLVLFIFIYIVFLVPVIQEMTSANKIEITNNKELKKDAAYKNQIGLMKKDIQLLSNKYNVYTSGQSYIVVNTTDNRFYLYKNKKLIREGFCSTGKLTMLKTEKGDKVWVFKTPKGKRWIHGKITNPSWNRPDWSFIEEGLPVPKKDDPSRWESGVLGDYAMSMGDGYLIHGTIYKRFLGMPVTHGCIRLNDEDLEIVYNSLSIGSKVYIF